MIDYLVDENFDIVLPLQKVTYPSDLLFQQVRLLLETFTNDFVYDVTAGMPYDESILSGGDVNIAEFESIYYKKISALVYFGSMENFTISLESNRELRISFSVFSSSGESQFFEQVA
jgi:hypothetical protein